MKESLEDEKLMTEYLLGSLSEEERSIVEERFLRDAEYFERLKSVEEEINDRYARGEMSEQERRLFEGRIIASPEWRSRAVFAKALLIDAEGDDATDEDRRASLPWWRSFAEMIGVRRPAFALSIAAAFLVAVTAGVWLWVETARLRSQLDELRSHQQEMERREREQQDRIDQAQSDADKLARELESERQRREALEAQLQSAESPSLLSFILTPGIGRGPGESTRLVIARGAKQVRLQLYLEGATGYESFNSQLRAAGDRIVLTKDSLTARQTRLGKAIDLIVPASLLASGEYEVIISGRTSAGGIEEIGSYYFNVIRQ
jgi:hypothetical protein